jgi:cytochrome P450
MNDGPAWKEQRTTALQILREMGMGKNVLAERVQEEVTHYVQAIEKHQGAPVDLAWLTICSVSNNICLVVFGQRFKYDDEEFQDYVQKADENLKRVGGECMCT